MARGDSVAERIDRLEIAFDELGLDKFGVSKKHLKTGLTALEFLYRRYFRVQAFGLEHIPPRGRVMLVGNHSGGYAIDGAMVLASLMLELDPPRLGHAMAERFLSRLPIASLWINRTGQLNGLPEHAIRLLEDDRVLIVFPEGARGTAKLYKERYSLVEFGTGFIRMALRTRSPIVPFAFLGGGSALPTVMNLYRLGKLVGVPYIPITAYGAPLPLPARLEVHYGAPMHFEGTGNEDDEVIHGYVEQVKHAIGELIERGRDRRHRARADEEQRRRERAANGSRS